VIGIGARSAPATLDAPTYLFELRICEGAHKGRTFALEADTAQPEGRSFLGRMQQALDLDLDASDRDAGAALDLGAALGQRLRATVWAWRDDSSKEAPHGRWHVSPAHEREFQPRERIVQPYSLIGDHFAKIVGSRIYGDKKFATAHLDVVLYRHKKRMRLAAIELDIIHPDKDVQMQNRVLMQDIGNALGVCEFDDTEAIHDFVFGITVWNDDPMRFNCRAASFEEQLNFEAASANPWLWPNGRIFGNGGGNAA
jgi:hypothetical protein